MKDERVWGVNYTTEIHLVDTEAGLELLAYVASDENATVVLDLDGVINLRKVLQRYEREQKKKQ